MNQLKDKLCVIPDYSDFELNVNTIKEDQAELLAAVLDTDKSTAETIISARPEDGFQDIADFWELKEVKGIKNIANVERSQFTVKSKFFKLITNAYYNEMRFDLTSVLQLDEQNEVHVIARRFGGKVEREADPETEQSDK
jgi:general secretion pathway protein K